MAALDPAVATVRSAVRGIAARLTSPASTSAGPTDGPPLVLVACSGGPDSMALAAAAHFVLPRLGLRVGLVTVDHQLQAGSAERAQTVAAWAHEAGFAPVAVQTVSVSGRPGGPEAAAREARYEALAAAARAHGARAVLLGHTRDDQAETVLLALVRGAGPRGLSGMPVRRVRHGVEFLRPLLGVSREQTRAACRAQDLPVWHDPHNVDPAFRRTGARTLLAQLVDHLGPAVVENLARTAHLVAADTAVLDRIARRALWRAREAGRGGLSVAVLARLPEAIRTRVLLRWAASLGAPGSALSHRHVAALDALVTDWHGQGPVSLPGGIPVVRREGALIVASAIGHPVTAQPGGVPAEQTALDGQPSQAAHRYGRQSGGRQSG
jgi:tRNA(Ile)-lysidine synthase